MTLLKTILRVAGDLRHLEVGLDRGARVGTVHARGSSAFTMSSECMHVDWAPLISSSSAMVAHVIACHDKLLITGRLA